MRYYTEEHEWVEVIDDEATIGISEYAAKQLGEISFVEELQALPAIKFVIILLVTQQDGYPYYQIGNIYHLK